MEDYTGDSLAERNNLRKKEMSPEDKEAIDFNYKNLNNAYFQADPHLMTSDDIIRRQLTQLIIMEGIHKQLLRVEGRSPTMRTIQLSKYLIDSYGRVYDQMKGKIVNVNTTNIKKFENDPEAQQIWDIARDAVDKLKKNGKLGRTERA